MSLIDEALRRAQAAQATGAAQGGRGLRVPMPLPDPGRFRRRRARRLAIASLVAAAVVSGAIFILRRGGEREPMAAAGAPATSVRKAVAATATPTETPTRAPVASRSEAAASVAAPTPRAVDSSAARITATPDNVPPAEAGVEPQAAQPPREAAPARRDAPQTPLILPPVEVSTASSSPRLAGGELPRPQKPPAEPTPRPRTYTGTANLPSGRLQLEGIVYSEASPTALINGRVVAPGGYVEGYTVLRIERDRVELKDEHETIILTLK